MKLSYILFILIFSFLFSIPSALSLEVLGKISSLSHSPTEPLAFNNMTISVGVQNIWNSTTDLKLKLFVTKEGQIKYETFFIFYSRQGETIFFSTTFVPDNIGEFEILAKLYDMYEIQLYDTRMIKFDVISKIGPFDLSLDVLARTVRPEEELPVVLRMRNEGIEGTDIKIKVEVFCVDQSLTNEFVVFFKPKSTLEKLISMPTCKEEGIHIISSSIILFDKPLISSFSQFFINKTFLRLDLEFPEIIEIVQGTSKIFDVIVKNSANTATNNLKVVVEKIPPEWVGIKPGSIRKIEPNETVVFIVNLSIPQDIGAKEYAIALGAAADEVYTNEKSTLKVLKASALPVEEIRKPSLLDQLAKSYTLILPLVFSFPAGLALLKLKGKVEERRTIKKREYILRKLRSVIKRS